MTDKLFTREEMKAAYTEGYADGDIYGGHNGRPNGIHQNLQDDWEDSHAYRLVVVAGAGVSPEATEPEMKSYFMALTFACEEAYQSYNVYGIVSTSITPITEAYAAVTKELMRSSDKDLSKGSYSVTAFNQV